MVKSLYAEISLGATRSVPCKDLFVMQTFMKLNVTMFHAEHLVNLNVEMSVWIEFKLFKCLDCLIYFTHFIPHVCCVASVLICVCLCLFTCLFVCACFCLLACSCVLACLLCVAVYICLCIFMSILHCFIV